VKPQIEGGVIGALAADLRYAWDTLVKEGAYPDEWWESYIGRVPTTRKKLNDAEILGLTYMAKVRDDAEAELKKSKPNRAARRALK